MPPEQGALEQLAPDLPLELPLELPGPLSAGRARLGAGGRTSSTASRGPLRPTLQACSASRPCTPTYAWRHDT